MINIHIITAFPNAFSYFDESIIKRAKNKGLINIEIVDLRNFTSDARKTIDDRPFGGGAGMLLQIEPIYKALKSLNAYLNRDSKTKIILTSAGGENWSQSKAKDFSLNVEDLIIICGHYEGVDYRVIEHLIDEEISIGNFVLSGGELASMILVDSIVRLLPDALGNEESAITETQFLEDKKIKEHPQYTRPETFKTDEGISWDVPKILLSGNHAEIEKWKKDNSQLLAL